MMLQEPERTGWPAGMLQDDDKKLSQWLSNRVDSRQHAREAAEQIRNSQRRINISSGEDACVDYA